MTIYLEERRVGDYTVRELTLGEIMDMRDDHPNGGKGLSLAMLGASVRNGSGEPIGVDGARGLPARLAGRLSSVVAELTGEAEGDDPNA